MTNTAWLSDEWVQATGAAIAGLGEFDGAVGIVAVEVGGTDGGLYWRRWEGGRLVAGGAGKPAEPADLTLGLTSAEAHAFWQGEWSPSVAFMRGQLKTAGDNALLFALLRPLSKADAGAALSAARTPASAS